MTDEELKAAEEFDRGVDEGYRIVSRRIRKRNDELLAGLKEVEDRERQPSHDEWMGILHDVVMCPTLKMEDRIRGLAQMDRITGETDPLTPEAVASYISQHLG